MSRYGRPEHVLCKMRVLTHEHLFSIIFVHLCSINSMEGGSLPSEGQVVCVSQ